MNEFGGSREEGRGKKVESRERKEQEGKQEMTMVLKEWNSQHDDMICMICMIR